MSAAIVLWVAALAAAPAAVPPPCVERGEQLFVAPMGEPFRSPPGGPKPAAAWFAAADADHDGRVSEAEMVADADRFFTRLDLDHDGEIAPEEVVNYENRVAPEIRLYQLPGYSGVGPIGRGKETADDRREAARRNPKGGDVYDGALGAGRYAWLNIPEPVASADLDMNRGVSRAEFRTTALARFRLLDAARAKALTLAAMPPTPAYLAACPPPDTRRRRR